MVNSRILLSKKAPCFYCLVKLLFFRLYLFCFLKKKKNFTLANTPHNPVRFENTVGLVVERVRLPHHIGKKKKKIKFVIFVSPCIHLFLLDSLRWYCDQCKEIVYQESFHCVDLGVQLKPIIEKYASSEELRTCKKCGYLNFAK